MQKEKGKGKFKERLDDWLTWYEGRHEREDKNPEERRTRLISEFVRELAFHKKEIEELKDILKKEEITPADFDNFGQGYQKTLKILLYKVMKIKGLLDKQPTERRFVAEDVKLAAAVAIKLLQENLYERMQYKAKIGQLSEFENMSVADPRFAKVGTITSIKLIEDTDIIKFSVLFGEANDVDGIHTETYVGSPFTEAGCFEPNMLAVILKAYKSPIKSDPESN